jgi:hypothetical protein
MNKLNPLAHMKDAALGALGIIVWLLVVIALGAAFGLAARNSFTIESFLSNLCGISMAISVFILLPLACFRRTRMVAGVTLLVFSYLFGLTTWILGLIVTWAFWGLLGIFIGFLLAGIGVVPLGLIASVLHGRWDLFWILMGNLALVFIPRAFAFFLIEHAGPKASGDEQVIATEPYTDEQNDANALPEGVASSTDEVTDAAGLLRHVVEGISRVQNHLADMQESIFSQRQGKDPDYELFGKIISQSCEVLVRAIDILEDKSQFNPQEYRDALKIKQYAKALLHSARLLGKVVAGLQRQSQGGRYGAKVYEADTRAFKKAQAGSVNLNNQVNKVYARYAT